MKSDSQKAVLLVTPFFPPQSHAAVFRFFKLAKYLPELGYKPIVLTTQQNYNYKEDESLLESVPGLEIHRVNYVEPTVRGLRMAFTGVDLSYKVTGPAVKAVETEAGEQKSSFSPVSSARSVYHWILKNELMTPDAFWPWVGPAVKCAKKLIKEKGIDLVVTSCHPYSSNVIGLKLKEQLGIKWVADFRDPLTYCHRTRSENPRIFFQQKKVERATFDTADAVTGLSSSYKLIYSDIYPHSQKVHFIPTGLDFDLIEKTEKPVEQDNTVIFPGEYLPSYDGAFFKAFAAAKKELPEDAKILIVGYQDLNRPRLEPLFERLGLLDRVEFVEHLPQRELYKLILRSRAGLLNPGSEATWWTNFAKMVDFVALEKPVLASVPDPSEARTCLQKAGLGVFLDGPLEKDIEQIKALFSGTNDSLVDREFCKSYSAREMAQGFANVFESLSK